MSAVPSSETRGYAVTGLGITVPAWRYASVVLGAAIGLCCGLPILFNASLPFFLLPLGKEFGWGRGDTSSVAVLAMLGATLASPFAGRLFDRFGPERVIGLSVLLFSAGVFAMSRVPGSLVAVGALCLFIGVAGCGTTMIGYAGVLPRWFDRRLGIALGISGLGSGVGVGLAPFVATRLIHDVGWRGAYTWFAMIACAGGVIAFFLIRRPRRNAGPASARAAARAASLAARDAAAGTTLREALRDHRFWILLAVTFVVPLAILGAALHGAALYSDRGLTAQQAAAGAALAGLGSIAARLGVGALIDRWSAPRVAACVFFAAGAGLVISANAHTFTLLCIGTFLGGAALGAEGDLLPFMIRRYFGMRAFGSIFGTLHSGYALGGVLGPIAYGYTYDRLQTYTPILLAGALLCAIGAVAIGRMGAYRFKAID